MYTAKQTITIAAPVSKVWDALTKPEIVKQYFFNTDLKTDWKKGSPITWSGEWEGKTYEDRGTVQEIEKHKLIKYTYWSAFSGKPDVPENYHNISYTFRDMGGNTAFTVEQDGHETEDAARHSEQNWGSVLEEMRKLLEKGKKGAAV